MQRKLKLADIPPEVVSPLDAAVTGRDRSVLDMVAKALKHKEVMLAFQPVVQARNPGTVAFYESFIRVLDETGRVIPAGQFMGKVEQDELGRELDCVSLRQGLKTLAQYRQLRLSVNMSARSIGYRKWNRILDRALREDASIGDRLILEIGEVSAMTVPELVIKFMTDMQARGVSFALDDYGAGNIAIRHFRQFLFDAVKIDGQFIRGIHQNTGNQLLVAALAGVAREFGMFTVAESVESEKDAIYLIEHGIDCLQGYFYGAPSVTPPWLPDAVEKAGIPKRA